MTRIQWYAEGMGKFRAVRRSDSSEKAPPQEGLGFRELVRASVKVKQRGWYATRQGLLKNGATLRDVARVLVWQLNILGVEETEGKVRDQWKKGCLAPELVYFGGKHPQRKGSRG